MEENIQKDDQPQDQTNQSQAPVPKAEKNTGMAIVAYILFFVPLLTDAKNDPFVKYHVKQGLVVFVGWIIVAIISAILPWSLWIISRLLNVLLLVLVVMGIMNASQGKQNPLPVVGNLAEKIKI